MSLRCHQQCEHQNSVSVCVYHLLLLLLTFKGLCLSPCYFFPFSLWVPLCDSLMPRLLLDHYPNPSPQHGVSDLTDSGCSHLKAAGFKKSSRQGRGACAVCCREAMGLTWPEKKTTVNGSERHPGKDNVFAGANIGLLINTPLSHCFYITALHASWDICTLAVSSKSIFRQTKDGERTNRCCCSDSNVSTRASAGFVCSYKRSSLSHTENKTNGWERGRDRGRERVRQDKKRRKVKTISYTHAAT